MEEPLRSALDGSRKLKKKVTLATVSFNIVVIEQLKSDSNDASQKLITDSLFFLTVHIVV